MNPVLSCRRSCGALAATRLIAAAALSLFFIVGLPASSQAQTFPQTNAQEQNRSAPPLDPKDMPAQALFSQAASLERESPEKAIAKYDEVMQRYGRGATPGSRQFAARALLNKGSLLSRQDNDKEAIFNYERIERNFSNERNPAIREVLASALVSKAEAFYKLGNAEKALDTYAQLDQQFGKDDSDFIMRLIDITKWRVAEIRDNNITLSSRP